MGGAGLLCLLLHLYLNLLLLLLVVGVGRQESLRIVVSANETMAGKSRVQCQAALHSVRECVCARGCECVCGYYLLGIKQTSNKKDNETRKQLKMEVAQQQQQQPQVKQMLGKCQTKHD